MSDFLEKDFHYSLEDKVDEKVDNSVKQNKHQIAAKNSQKHTLWDSLKELPAKADNISKNYRIWARQRKNLWFYKKYLDRVKSGLYDRYGSEARVKENIMKDDPVEILKGPAQQYIKVIVDDINKLYQEVLELSKKLEHAVSAEQAINIIRKYAEDYIHQDIKGKETKEDMSWHNKLLYSTKYKIAKILLRDGEHKVYGYTAKNMVLKGYPKPNHLIVALFVINPEEAPEEQSVTDVFKSSDSFDILASSDKTDIFKISSMTASVLNKTVDNKVMEEIKLFKNNALNEFKNAKMEDKKDQGKIIDSIWDGIKESCKELLSRKKYIIECINIYYDMILRIDKLAVTAIERMLDVEDEHRDKRYDKHAKIGHGSDIRDKMHRKINKINERGIIGSVNDALQGSQDDQERRKNMSDTVKKLNRMQ